MPDESELARLDPDPIPCKLTSGFAIEVVRLQTRQFFRLLKVLTHGAGSAIMQAGLDFSSEPDVFAQRLVVLMIMSVPDAEQEAIAFLQSMCEPAGLVRKPALKLSKQDREDNQKLWDEFALEMHNPPITDTVDLIETITRREAPELQALGKRLVALFALFQKSGKDKETAETPPTPQELSEAAAEDLPEPSPTSSTSSATSTDGQMSISSTSRSAASGKQSKRQPAA